MSREYTVGELRLHGSITASTSISSTLDAVERAIEFVSKVVEFFPKIDNMYVHVYNYDENDNDKVFVSVEYDRDLDKLRVSIRRSCKLEGVKCVPVETNVVDGVEVKYELSFGIAKLVTEIEGEFNVDELNKVVEFVGSALEKLKRFPSCGQLRNR